MCTHRKFVTCILLILWAPLVQEPTRSLGQESTITADPEIQTAIRAIAKELAGRERISDEGLLQMRRFAEKHIGASVHVVQQILLFYAREGTADNFLTMSTAIKMFKIQSWEVRDASVPLLDAEDERLRELAHRMLARVDRGLEGRTVDFTIYEGWLSTRAPKTPPLSLVRYMVETDPGKAVISLSNVYLPTPEARKPVLWAEHIVSDAIWKRTHGFTDAAEKAEPTAIAELEKQSKHDAWWARLYVAELMTQHPELHKVEIIERLEKDEHELVRMAIDRSG